MTDYLEDDQHKPVTDYLLSLGFIVADGGLAYSWSTREGMSNTMLVFVPHNTGWWPVISTHASGENPMMGIGTCETWEDVHAVCEVIRRINGYRQAEAWRGPK